MYQDGLVFHAAAVTFCSKALLLMGPCVAIMTAVVFGQPTLNLLSSFFDDGMIPAGQKDPAVATACAIAANGFDPCPVRNYSIGGVGFLDSATLDRYAGILKLSNFLELAGHHQFKYGIDVAQDYYNQTKSYTGGQSFDARPLGNNPVDQYRGIRGYGKADPLHPGFPLFAPVGTDGGVRLQGNAPNNQTKNVSLAFFAQDTWNILDKIVLDIGVRGESQKMYADKNSLDINGNAVDGPGLTLTNFMPRIGLIYDWTGRGLSKVYASYGQFYEYVPLDLADRALSAETQVTYSTNAASCTNPKDPRTCAVITNGNGATAMMRLSLNALPKVAMTFTGSMPAKRPVTSAEPVTTSIGFIRSAKPATTSRIPMSGQ